MRLALALTIVAVTATPPALAAPHAFAEDLKFEGVDFSRENTGHLKARALLSTVTICEFAKYAARDGMEQKPGPRLLVLRFARKLSADQVQQVFRGVVRGRSGYSEADLETFLKLLPSAKAGSVLQFRSDATGRLEVFAGNKLVGSVVAAQLALAVWAGLGSDT